MPACGSKFVSGRVMTVTQDCGFFLFFAERLPCHCNVMYKLMRADTNWHMLLCGSSYCTHHMLGCMHVELGEGLSGCHAPVSSLLLQLY